MHYQARLYANNEFNPKLLLVKSQQNLSQDVDRILQISTQIVRNLVNEKN